VDATFRFGWVLPGTAVDNELGAYLKSDGLASESLDEDLHVFRMWRSLKYRKVV
jgi:hypothetical protein